MTSPEAILRRIRIRSAIIGGLSGAVAFLFGWESGVSLTICAAVVIFSFLVLERLTERLLFPQVKTGIRAYLPVLLVMAAGLLLLGIVLFHWKGFDPVAGAVGLSSVVLAVVPEIWGKE